MADLDDRGVKLGFGQVSIRRSKSHRDMNETTFRSKDQISCCQDTDRLFLLGDDQDRGVVRHHRRGVVHRAIVFDKLDRPCHDRADFDIVGLQILHDHFLDDISRGYASETGFRVLDQRAGRLLPFQQRSRSVTETSLSKQLGLQPL